MIYELLFYLVILLANIMQGITGFAGTILAMPFSVRLVGFSVARPVLNGLGVAAGIYVAVQGYKHINVKQLIKIVLCMSIGIFGGIYIKDLFAGKERMMFLILGTFVVFVGVKGIILSIYKAGKDKNKQTDSVTSNGTNKDGLIHKLIGYILILLAGVIHGMFVCGGPLLISYLSKEIKEKEEFRSTISAVWIVLNSIILVTDITKGYYVGETIRMQLVSLPFLFAAIFIGGILVKRMSQQVFSYIMYVLLIIAGSSLFFK